MDLDVIHSYLEHFKQQHRDHHQQEPAEKDLKLYHQIAVQHMHADRLETLFDTQQVDAFFAYLDDLLQDYPTRWMNMIFTGEYPRKIQIIETFLLTPTRHHYLNTRFEFTPGLYTLLFVLALKHRLPKIQALAKTRLQEYEYSSLEFIEWPMYMNDPDLLEQVLQYVSTTLPNSYLWIWNSAWDKRGGSKSHYTRYMTPCIKAMAGHPTFQRVLASIPEEAMNNHYSWIMEAKECIWERCQTEAIRTIVSLVLEACLPQDIIKYVLSAFI